MITPSARLRFRKAAALSSTMMSTSVRFPRRPRGSYMSVAEFARREGVGVKRLYFWRARLAATNAASTFVEVVRPEPAVSRSAPMIEVVLRSGDVLRVTGDVDRVGLRDIVEVLRSC